MRDAAVDSDCGGAGKSIEWHIKHYVGRGLMKTFKHGSELAKDMGIDPSVLEGLFEAYNAEAEEVKRTGKPGPYGKKFYHHLPFKMDDTFHVATVVPIVHYCMGKAPRRAAPRASLQPTEPMRRRRPRERARRGSGRQD